MCLGENKKFSAFGPGNSDGRSGASSSPLTGFHALSTCIKAMDDEACLFFVMHSLLVFVHRWAYEYFKLLSGTCLISHVVFSSLL
jgi:hypothetical protein